MQKTDWTEESFFGMNTLTVLNGFGVNAELAITKAKNEFMRLEQRFSRYISDSDISQLNRAAGKISIKISPETMEVLNFAMIMSEISQGLFNILIGPMEDLWNYKIASSVPPIDDIRRILPLMDYRDLILDTAKNTAFLRKPDQSADLGGIAKGFASDRCIRILSEMGVPSACVNIGGNVSTLGTKPDGTPWIVGIRHPRLDNELIGAISAADRSVVTSGDYERFFFDRNGVRWHHILHPDTGYPAQSGLMSVTVVDHNAMIADALSTALFVAGIDQGMEILSNFTGTDALFIDSRLQIFITEGLVDSYRAVESSRTSIL